MNASAKIYGSSRPGTDLTRFNALRHGGRAQTVVLPWEDATDYEQLLAALVEEHDPRGPTEEHLVEELAGIIWRKRRLRQAEAAAYQRGLSMTLAHGRGTASAAIAHLGDKGAAGDVGEAMRASKPDDIAELAALASEEAFLREALEIMAAGGPNSYADAYEKLSDAVCRWWGDVLGGRDVSGLKAFIEDEALPSLSERRREVTNRPQIRAQAFGEALDPERLERLARYEVHFDRKLERTLTMLIRLQDLRPAGGDD